MMLTYKKGAAVDFMEIDRQLTETLIVMYY